MAAAETKGREYNPRAERQMTRRLRNAKLERANETREVFHRPSLPYHYDTRTMIN